ncbi:MAG TPA: hypothetical protein VGP13_02620, partial [Candidatus Paceibacterota bacterium]|nr:hypothetical protein [Candidatus Paceibacterota bacterium]
MKAKTNWDLERLFYTSLKDPNIVKDIAKGDKAVDAFVAKYSKNKTWLVSAKALSQALKDYEQSTITCTAAPLYYANYRKELNAKDKEAEAFLNKSDDHFTKRGNKLLFFELELGKVPAAKQKEFLKAKELQWLNYWLTKLFETSKHNLTEPEEKIL